MEFIESGILLHCTGQSVSCEKAFKNRRLVLLYFGSSESPACMNILATLKAIYQTSQKIHLSLEIIYVSFDPVDIMETHFKQRHGGWYAIAPNDPAKIVLSHVYNITHIPEIVVLGPEGEVITTKGVKEIEELGLNVLVSWAIFPPK